MLLSALPDDISVRSLPAYTPNLLIAVDVSESVLQKAVETEPLQTEHDMNR